MCRASWISGNSSTLPLSQRNKVSHEPRGVCTLSSLGSPPRSALSKTTSAQRSLPERRAEFDLTAIGRAFLVETQRVLDAASQARQVVTQMQGLQRGTLSIGLIQGLAPLIDISELIGRFRIETPNIEIRLISDGTLPLIERVRAGELDLAFTEFIGVPPSGIGAWMLACEPLVVVCGRGHRLAGQQDLDLDDLIGETFVELQPDWGARKLIDQSFAERRLTRRIGFEVNDPATQVDLVAHGLGVALVPKAAIIERLAGSAGEHLAVAELAEPEICWEVAAMFPQGTDQPLGTLARTFLDFLRASVPPLEEVGAAA